MSKILAGLTITNAQYEHIVDELNHGRRLHAIKALFDYGISYDKEKPWIRQRFISLQESHDAIQSLKAKL